MAGPAPAGAGGLADGRGARDGLMGGGAEVAGGVGEAVEAELAGAVGEVVGAEAAGGVGEVVGGERDRWGGGRGAGAARGLREPEVVAMAGLAWIGAIVAPPVPIAAAIVATSAAAMLRRPLAFVLAVGLLAAGLGHRSNEAFVPVDPAVVTGERVTVVDDPRPVRAGWRATVRRGDGRRLLAVAHGSAGFRLSRAGAGDRIVVSGRVAPIDDSGWARSRHLLGRVTVDELAVVGGPTGPRRAVEGVRSLIVAGADQLPEADRPLYLGLVIGEDRLQSPDQRARFTAAGLAHLLAVSGQNVAFVLAVARPVVRRLPPRVRLVVVGLLLVVFAVATRLEPSVLRATVTAGLAAVAALDGNGQSGVRLLGLAVTALLLIDPFLVRSVGFALSVSASAGILLITPTLARRLPGPAIIVEPVAVTLGAQLAVAPILVRLFGPISAMSVPANVAAGWAAGAVMMWGLTAGVLAGLVGGSAGRRIQLPAEALLAWLDGVATWAARVPAPRLDGSSLTVVVLILTALWLLSTRSPTGVRVRMAPARTMWSILRVVVSAGLAAALIAVTVAAMPQPPGAPAGLDGGGRWIPDGDGRPSVLVIERGADDRLLEAMIEAGIVRVDVVVAEGGTGPSATLVSAVMRLVTTGVVVAPPLHRIVGARRITSEITIETSGPTLTVSPAGTRLDVALDEPP